MPQVREYIDQNGHNHYRKFFNALGAAAAAKVATVSAHLATGHTSGLKSLGGGLAEWRLDLSRKRTASCANTSRARKPLGIKRQRRTTKEARPARSIERSNHLTA